MKNKILAFIGDIIYAVGDSVTTYGGWYLLIVLAWAAGKWL